MSLKSLVKNQVIKIDDHKWGSREIKEWNNPAQDVHIDKSTNFPLAGKIQKVRIKIPLNSKRDVKITSQKDEKLQEIPRALKKEIQNAFADPEKRERFLKDLVSTLKDFKSTLKDRDKAKQAVEKIAAHLDLGWSTAEIEERTDAALSKYTEVFTDEQNEQYFVTIDSKQIRAGQNTGEAYDRKLLKK